MPEMSNERLADIDRRLGAGGGYTGAPTKHELRTALIELVDEVRRQRRAERSAAEDQGAMSEERLAEIRKAAEQYRGSLTVRNKPNGAIAHRGELLAEVERLRKQAREDAEHTILVQQYGAQLLNERNDAQRQIDALVTSDKAKQGAADWMLNRLHDDRLIDDSTYGSLCGLLRDQIDATRFWTHSEDWGPLTDRLQAALKRAKTAEDQRDGAINAWAAQQDLVETERRRADTAERELADLHACLGKPGAEWRFDDGAGWFTITRKPLSDADVHHLRKTTGRPVEHRIVGEWREIGGGNAT